MSHDQAEAITPESLTATGWKQHTLQGHMGQMGPLWSQPLETGGWRYGMCMEDRHLNPAGMVHGGVLLTLADHAMSAVAWQHSQRQPCVTVQLDSQFLAPARAGDWVQARVDITHSSRSMVFASAQLWVGSQQVLQAQGILKVLAAPTAASPS